MEFRGGPNEGKKKCSMSSSVSGGPVVAKKPAMILV